MLPSTGYFKGLRCPFYDSGICERPHCHYRHVKRESFSTNSGEVNKTTCLRTTNSLNELNIESSSAATCLPEGHVSTAKATYNPTPIAELNKVNSSDVMNGAVKRHIPVPYTPRKPTSLPLKRTFEIEVEEKLTYIPPAKYQPGSAETPKVDPYTPSGSSVSTEQYMPGTQTVLQEYKPVETNKSSNLSYVPSDTKTEHKKKILEYEPVKMKSKTAPSVTYQPTPKSIVPCFSSDEEEPQVKKSDITSDLNELDDLGAEFDILEQILDEEKDKENSSKKIVSDKIFKFETYRIDSKSSKQSENSEKSNSNKNNSSDKQSKSSNSSNTIASNKSSNTDKDRRNNVKAEKKSRSSNKNEVKEKSQEKDSSRKEKKNNEKDKTKVRSKEKDRIKEKDRDKVRDKDKSKEKDREKDKIKEKNRSKDKDRSRDRSKDKHKSKDRDKERSREKETRVRHSKSNNSNEKSKHKSKHSSSNKGKDKLDKDRTSKTKHRTDGNQYESDDSIHRDELESTMEIDVDELIEDISESDEESIALECKRIFEEYVPDPKPIMRSPSVEKETINDSEEYVPMKKRISLAADKNVKITPKPTMKPDYKVGAAQMMAARLAKVKEYHAAKMYENNTEALKPNDSHKTNSTCTSAGNSKIRIAHVPYASSLMTARKNISTAPVPPKPELSCSSTSIQTVKKGASRVAHLPNDKFIDRPGVLEPLASKIPANIRSTYLNMMIDECLKIYLNAPDAYARAQHEELNTSKKCKAIQIYKNSALLAVSRLRKEFQECNGIKKSASDCKTLQSLPSNESWSVLSKNRRNSTDPNEMKGRKFYENISKWILTEEQLRDNGFPRSHPDGGKGRAKIYSENRKKPPKGLIRNCCRCKKDYTIDKKGFAVVKEECIYHPNNKYRFRGEVKYQCCSQDGMSDGCCMAPTHVYEYVDYDNLTGFVKTMPPDRERSDYGVYALDCEMCYTTQGLDLTRITVIDSTCKVIYETLIKPLHPIIDYNTRYSGITEEQMAGVRTTLLEVQATLLTMFCSKTILVGHSLESDFKALKLIHDTVIDTSVLFPHKMGPPYKRALRNLSSEYIKKIIQNSVEGHDSAEDATVCMELLHYKLKEDLKIR